MAFSPNNTSKERATRMEEGILVVLMNRTGWNSEELAGPRLAQFGTAGTVYAFPWSQPANKSQVKRNCGFTFICAAL
jgi:hypothetical protein